MGNRSLMTRNKILCAIILALWIIPITFRSNCFAAAPITWSPADAGLRLGLKTEQSRINANLRVVLNNVGPSNLSVFVAMKSGNGACYLFQFTAIAADGRRLSISNLSPESCQPSAGLVLPEVISLAPGATREFAFLLKHLVYMTKGRDITLDSLLRQGYAISASLKIRQKDLDGALMGGVPQPANGRFWTGRLTSPPPRP
jgi:hypothetical protein